ncbi:YczE/YyaS/YitT family protein [Laceyella putida]|uniref:YitT family protein n=1 Tax=Laceyella putida TaxID=110101 RepID=A0ABW2RK60_9BACL
MNGMFRQVAWRTARLWRWVFFFGGLWIMALGTVFAIKSNLGVAPWDVLHIGLAHVSRLSIGTWVTVFGILILGVTCWLQRSLPQWGTFLNMLLLGPFIDFIFFLEFIPDVHGLIWRLSFLTFGVMLVSLGAGMYIAPRVGAGPRDGLTLEISNRTGWSIRAIRTIMEVIVGGCGWFLGGPVHIGTLFFCFLTGPLMQWSISFWERLLERILKRGVILENLDKRAVRAHHHDGSGC